jgi:hypothetical protein
LLLLSLALCPWFSLYPSSIHTSILFFIPYPSLLLLFPLFPLSLPPSIPLTLRSVTPYLPSSSPSSWFTDWTSNDWTSKTELRTVELRATPT